MPELKQEPVGSGITPQQPKEPPKEVLEMTFKADNTLLGKEPTQTLTTEEGVTVKADNDKGTEKAAVAKEEKVVEKAPAKEEKAKEEATDPLFKVLKPPTKVETKVEEKGKGKEVIKTIAPAAKTEDAFDYTGFTPQEQTNLKNMSRQSREYTAQLIKDNKSLASLKDSTYLQHERGYTLNPEYQTLQQDAQMARAEGNVWQQQLMLCKSGKAFHDIIGWNKDGSPKYGPELQPTDEHEERLRSNVLNCSQATNQLNGKLQTFPDQFKGRLEGDLQAIKTEMNQRFAWVADPKLLEHSISIEGMGDVPVKQIVSDFKNLFPPYLSNSIGVEVAANMMVAMQIISAQLREAQNGQQVATIKQQEIARGEPSGDNKPLKQAEAVGGVSEFSLAGMPR